MKRPKYFVNDSADMLYAVYPDKAYYVCGDNWLESYIFKPLRNFETGSLAEDYRLCHLCDVRADFNNIKAHKRTPDTVAPGTQPA